VGEDSNLADADQVADDIEYESEPRGAVTPTERSPSGDEESLPSDPAVDEDPGEGQRPRFVTASFRVPTEMLEAMGESGLAQSEMVAARKEIGQTAVFEDPGVQITQSSPVPSVPTEAVAPPRTQSGRRRRSPADDASEDASISSGQLAKLAIKKLRVGTARKKLDVPEIIEIQADSSQAISDLPGSQPASGLRRKGQHVIFQGRCDPKGRVRIPQDVVKELGLGAGDAVEVWVKKTTF
jgi:hypothetical protein